MGGVGDHSAFGSHSLCLWVSKYSHPQIPLHLLCLLNVLFPSSQAICCLVPCYLDSGGVQQMLGILGPTLGVLPYPQEIGPTPDTLIL